MLSLVLKGLVVLKALSAAMSLSSFLAPFLGFSSLVCFKHDWKPDVVSLHGGGEDVSRPPALPSCRKANIKRPCAGSPRGPDLPV